MMRPTCDGPPIEPGLFAPSAPLADDETSRFLRRAAILEVSARGYREVGVADIAARAGVGRNSFYARMANKQACVVAAAEEVAVLGLGAAARRPVAEGPERTAPANGGDDRQAAGERPEGARGDDRLVALIAAALDRAASHPDAARLLLAEVCAAGPAGAAVRERALHAFGDLVVEALGASGARPRVRCAVARAVAGGVGRIVVSRVASGRAAELPALAPALAAWAASYRALLAEPGVLAEPPHPRAEPPRRRGRAPGSLVPPSDGGRRTLSPGRRREPRSFVEASQRDRIFDAVATCAADEGYDGLTADGLCARAQVSLTTLYERFPSVQAAFRATLAAGGRGALAAALPEMMARHDPRHGIHAGIAALTEFLAEEPAFARVAVVEALSAGRAGLDAQTEALGVMAAVLTHAIDGPGGRSVAAEAVAAAVWEVCAQRIRAGRTAELPALAPTLTCLALTPFAGAAAALAAVEEAEHAPELLPVANLRRE